MKTKFRRLVQCTLSLLLTVLITQPTHATISNNMLDFFNENGIYYYDPTGSGITCVAGNNASYSGAQVFSSATWELIQANQPFYEEATAQYGYPWQVLAAVHYKEYGNQRGNPSNGQGAYQLYSYTAGGSNANAFYPAGAISDEEFQRQSNIAAGILNDMAAGEGLDLNDSGDIKRLFFKYNGTASKYYNRAISMGYSEEDAHNGEGSPYVMNRFDPQRDPTSSEMSPLWRGMYVGDGQWSDTATTTSFGAFVAYTALGGATSGGECSDGGLIAGGMNFQQAQEFMQIYKNLQDEWKDCRSSFCSPWRIQYIAACGTAYSNCVGLSQYFINRYTTIGNDLAPDGSSGGVGGLPDGNQVVSRLLNSYPGSFTDGGTTPRPYAIFSTTAQSGRNHTGVILGVDIANNKVYTGEAGCGNYNFTGAYEYSLSEMSNGNYIYAYTDMIVKLGNEGNENNTDGEGGDLTIIGDSITVGAANKIKSYYPNADINAKVSRQFTEGISIAEGLNLRQNVVFALGTNNTNLTTAQIESAISAIGNDKNIYFITNYRSDNPSAYDNNNQNLQSAANNNPNIHIIDWAASASANPSRYISSDHIHPTAAGQQLFADLIHQALN